MAKKGYKCGNGWIAKGLKCHKGISEETSASLDAVTKLINTSSGVSRKKLRTFFENLPEEEKTIFSQNIGIFSSLETALGVQAYFGANYSDINRYFYDEEYRKEAPEDIKMKAEAAKLGFEELPKHSKEEIQKHYKAKGVDYDGETVYRGLSFSSQDQLESFLSTHTEGSEVEYKAFTSTAMANPETAIGKVDGGWSRKPVQIVIKQKENSEGKWVDQRKRSKDESEILFKPGTKFKVAKIESDEREKLPDRLNDPIQHIFGKSEEGFGTKTLPVSTLLGEKPPEAILNDPNFSYFKQFLKKRLPPTEEWNNLTFSDIFTVSNMKGGRFLIANEITKALQDQVKPDEHTGITEHSNVKIFLEEL